MIRESSKGLTLGKGKQGRHLQLIRRQVFGVNLWAHAVLRIHRLLMDGLVGCERKIRYVKLANNSSTNNWICRR